MKASIRETYRFGNDWSGFQQASSRATGSPSLFFETDFNPPMDGLVTIVPLIGKLELLEWSVFEYNGLWDGFPVLEGLGQGLLSISGAWGMFHPHMS